MQGRSAPTSGGTPGISRARFNPSCISQNCRVIGTGHAPNQPGIGADASYRYRMELTGLGGGLMLAIAAILWLAYLLPNWFKQREYLATEKNAVRLQQTIRVLAETTDASAGVRPSVSESAKLPPTPVAVGRPVAAPQAPRRDPAVLAAARIRRSRIFATVVLLVAFVAAIVQLVLIVAIGAVPGSWFVLAGAGVAGAASVGLLRRLAVASRSRHHGSAAPRASQPMRDFQPSESAAPAAERDASWTPVATPKPLYLSRSEVKPEPKVDPVAELERAAAAAEWALRSREQPRTIQPQVPSRFASMGIVDAAGTSTPDIDAVLAKRRVAG